MAKSKSATIRDLEFNPDDPDDPATQYIVRDTDSHIDYMEARPIPGQQYKICCYATEEQSDDFMVLQQKSEVMEDYYDILKRFEEEPNPRHRLPWNRKLPSELFYCTYFGGDDHVAHFSREEADQMLASFPTYLRLKEEMDPIVATFEY